VSDEQNMLLPETVVTEKNVASFVESIRSKDYLRQEKLVEKIKEVILAVKMNGDKAIQHYTAFYDGVPLNTGEFRIPGELLMKSVQQVDDDFLEAVKLSLRRLEVVQRRIIKSISFSMILSGFKISLSPVPLSSVGCYVPGGRAPYASTVIMTAGLSKIAGVKRVVVCTPPRRDGGVDPHILAAAKLCGVDEVYRIGGAQAIAALAYGTESVPKVQKIIGPGGAPVSLAKQILSSETEIDFVAGPTELIVLADNSANSRYVALDLIAQAEHGADTICGLVTFSKEMVKQIRSELIKVLRHTGRLEYVRSSLQRGFSAICNNESTAIQLLNRLAPEHLEIMTKYPERISTKVKSAGLKLLGLYSPAAASDYLAGTNHVIPTSGRATYTGSLSVLDVTKFGWTITGSRKGLSAIHNHIRTLAVAEDLKNHYLSVEERLR